MISHKLKFIFIHIPKTSGNSLSLFLKNLINNGITCSKGNGNGEGINLEVSLSYFFFENWALNVGYRYWSIDSKDNDSTTFASDGTSSTIIKGSNFDLERWGGTMGITCYF